MRQLRTIRAKRAKKPYWVLRVGHYPEAGEDYFSYTTKAKAFERARDLAEQFGEEYWVIEVSFKPLLGR